MRAAEDRSRTGRPPLALMRRQLADLRKQKPPASDTDRMRSWLAAGDDLIAVLAREDRVSTRDSARVAAALKRHTGKPRRKLTAWDLQHPTASIINDLMQLRQYQRFEADMRKIVRESAPVQARFARLGRELGLHDCVK